MSTVLSPEEMNRELQVTYPVFLKTWYKYAMDQDLTEQGDCSFAACRRAGKSGRPEDFDSPAIRLMRSDFTTYIKKCNYQFSTKDKNAEKKTIAMMRAEFDKWEQEWEIERANEQAKHEKQDIVLGVR